MIADGVPTPRPALEGEDLSTLNREKAQHWLEVYASLLRFNRLLLDALDGQLGNPNPEVRRAATADLGIISGQREGYQARLDLWFQRVWDLRGLFLDSKNCSVGQPGSDARLTERGFQLLQFLVIHPHRFYSAAQITSLAWGRSTTVATELRESVRGVRRILVRMAIPYELINRRGRGYSLVFRADA